MYDMGSKLRTIRDKRKITQKALALKINKSVSAISSYESNAQVPPTEVLVSISQALHVPIAYFVGMNNDIAYSSSGLTAEQIHIMDCIYEEFTQPSTDQQQLQ